MNFTATQVQMYITLAIMLAESALMLQFGEQRLAGPSDFEQTLLLRCKLYKQA